MTVASARQDTPFAALPTLSGLLAPIVYVGTVVAGGASLPGYSHLHDSISSLTESGRVGVFWIQFGFLIYNVLVGTFAIGSLWVYRRERALNAIFGLLLLTATCGLVMWPFPQDPIGTPLTTAGLLHIILAAVESLSTVAVLAICTWQLFSRSERTLGALAASCFVVTTIFGFASAMAVQTASPMMGLYERLTIGSFELWTFALALILLRHPGALAAARPHE